MKTSFFFILYLVLDTIKLFVFNRNKNRLKALFVLPLTFMFYSCDTNTNQTQIKPQTKPQIDSISRADSLHCLCDSTLIIQNDSKIEGYTDKISYLPGETVELYISSKSKNFKIELVDQSLDSKSLLLINDSNGIVQNYNQCAFKDGCNWILTNKIKIPKNAVSSYMTIHLSNEYHQFKIPIIVKSPIKNKILCLASTNTWHAYNGWGKANFYRYEVNDSCKIKKQSSQLSLLRPIKIVGGLEYKGHLFDAELALIHWLEREKYSFDIVSDTDIHLNPNLLMDYDLVFLNTHSEYWTRNAFDGMEKYINNKGSLCHIGANGMYWKVTLSNNTIECIKTQGVHESDSTKGGKWRDLGKPEEKILGAAYDAVGYDTYMPYVVINEDHWLFENTKLENGDLFGKSVNRKYASGHETDKMTSNSPDNIILLARGVNQEAVYELGKEGASRHGGADMVYFETPNGGSVFSTGSITSSGSMLVDSNMSIIINNMIRNKLK